MTLPAVSQAESATVKPDLVDFKVERSFKKPESSELRQVRAERANLSLKTDTQDYRELILGIRGQI